MHSWRIRVVLLAAAVIASPFNPLDQLQTDEIIDAVNAAKTTWKAGRNFHSSLKKSYLKNLVGSTVRSRQKRQDDEQLYDYDNLDIGEFEDLPVNFDARKKWKNCQSLHRIRDQGSCGSCWAVSAASAFSDRLCIASNGVINSELSAQQLLSCCSQCGHGCHGGDPAGAWQYFQYHGLVTGGGYDSHEGCQPYTFAECEHYMTGPRETCRDDYTNIPTPKCRKICYNEAYKKRSFIKDLHRLNSTFRMATHDSHMRPLPLKPVQKELYDNGPITAGFIVYEDFLAYKTGVYQYTTGNMVYGHAVKVIGWGEEDGTPYWLVANSWNSDWGDNGYFKIKRGSNECEFEEFFLGGTPDVSSY